MNHPAFLTFVLLATSSCHLRDQATTGKEAGGKPGVSTKPSPTPLPGSHARKPRDKSSEEKAGAANQAEKGAPPTLEPGPVLSAPEQAAGEERAAVFPALPLYPGHDRQARTEYEASFKEAEALYPEAFVPGSPANLRLQDMDRDIRKLDLKPDFFSRPNRPLILVKTLLKEKGTRSGIVPGYSGASNSFYGRFLEAERLALLRYPESGVKGSELNKGVAELTDNYRNTNPSRLEHPAWPLLVVEQVARRQGKFIVPPVVMPPASVVSAAQEKAVRMYPDSVIEGTELNKAVTALRQDYQKALPEFFMYPSWPVTLVEEAALKMKGN